MATSLLRKRNPALLSGSELIYRLVPTKRVLCLCPVLTSECDDELARDGYERYRIGMAVSDPYLDRAIPVEGSCDKTDGLYVYKGVGVTNKVDRPAFWRGMAPTKEEFLDMLSYTDIGAVALALPMMVGGKYRRTGLAEMKLEAARSSLRCVLNNFVLTLDGEGKDSFAGRDGSDAGTNADQDDAGASFASANTPTKNEFELQCDINDSLSLDEALQMAREKPDMWEEVGLPMQGKGLGVYQQRKVELIPSKHAAVALNSFLWTHARGRNNTFG